MSDTTTPTTPSTLLEAVNKLLNAIRVSSITTLLEADRSEDAAGAKKALDDTSRDVQAEGWVTNKEYSYVLEVDTDGYLNLPLNTLKVVTARYSQDNHRLVQRGTKLYDPIDHTNVFAIGTTATVDLVVALEFADLTHALRAYITGKAARAFCLPKLPEQATFAYTNEFVQQALVLAQQEETEQLDADLGDTSPHFADMRKR